MRAEIVTTPLIVHSLRLLVQGFQSACIVNGIARNLQSMACLVVHGVHRVMASSCILRSTNLKEAFTLTKPVISAVLFAANDIVLLSLSTPQAASTFRGETLQWFAICVVYQQPGMFPSRSFFNFNTHLLVHTLRSVEPDGSQTCLNLLSSQIC